MRNVGEQDAQVTASFGVAGETRFKFQIKYSEQPLNSIGADQPANMAATAAAAPVFIPAKEILSLMPDIIGISEQNSDVFDSTYTDLAKQLTIRAPKEPPAFIKPLLDAWASLMQGTIVSEDGRFYFHPLAGARFRVGLAAEGFRKLGTLVHLLASGILTKQTTLF